MTLTPAEPSSTKYGTRSIPPSGEPPMAMLRLEIHYIGVNINQIARSVNAGIARPADAKRGLYMLEQVYEMMNRLAKKGS